MRRALGLYRCAPAAGRAGSRARAATPGRPVRRRSSEAALRAGRRGTGDRAARAPRSYRRRPGEPPRGRRDCGRRGTHGARASGAGAGRGAGDDPRPSNQAWTCQPGAERTAGGGAAGQDAIAAVQAELGETCERLATADAAREKLQQRLSAIEAAYAEEQNARQQAERARRDADVARTVAERRLRQLDLTAGEPVERTARWPGRPAKARMPRRRQSHATRPVAARPSLSLVCPSLSPSSGG